MNARTGTPRRRRLWKWAVRLAVAAIVTRLLLAASLGWIVDRVARSGGLTVDYRTASLSLHRLTLHFDDLVARDSADELAPPLFTAQQLDVDLSTWQLLHGEIVVVDAAIAGARIHVEKRADGSLRLPAAWSVPTPERAEPPPSNEPVRFDLPVRVVSARLHDVSLVVADPVRGTRDECLLGIDVAGIGDPTRPGRIAINGDAPDRCDRFWLEADVATAETAMSIVWRAGVRGLRCRTLPDVRTFDIDASGEAAARRDPDAPTLAAASANVHVATSADDEPFFTIDAKTGDPHREGDDLVIPFAFTASGARLAAEVTIGNATCRWSPARTTIDAELLCRELSLQRCAPWLAAIGVELPADGISGNASTHVDVVTATGTPAVSASIENVTVGRDDDRASLRRAALTDLRLVDGRTSIAAIEVVAPRVGITRCADGRVAVAGIRFGGATLTPQMAAPVKPAGPPPPIGLPAVVVHALECRGAELSFVDEALPQPATVRLLEGTVQAQDLALDGGDRGRCTVTFLVEDAVGGVHATAELRTSADSLSANCSVTAHDVTLRALAPWLTPAGITPEMNGATLRGQASCTLAFAPGTITVGTNVSSVQLQDRGEVLLSVRNVQGDGLRIDTDGFHLGRWTAMDPYTVLRRAPDGTLHACGLAFAPRPAPAATAAPAPANPTKPTENRSAPPPGPTRLRHGGVALHGAALHWIDDGRSPAIDVTLTASATIAADDGAGGVVPFDAELRVGRAIETCTVKGSYRFDATAARVDASLAAEGLHGDALTGLLPAPLQCTLTDGRLGAHVVADVTLLPNPGATVRIDQVRLADGDVEAFAIDSIALDAPRLGRDRVHVKSLRIAGTRAVAATSADGFHGPGFALRSITPPPAPRLADAGTSATAPPPKPTLLTLPALRVDELDLRLDRLTWRDRVDGEGRPVTATARLRLVEPWSTAEDLADTPPLRLEFTGTVDPFCREWQVAATLAPFELRPTIDLSVRATGIDTTAAATVLPRLAKQVQGIVADATLEATAHATLDLRRPTPHVVPIGQPFGAVLSVENWRLAEGDAPPLAAMAYGSIEIRSFDPRTGALLVRSVEIDDPHLRIERNTAGLDAFGIRLLPVAATPSTSDAAAAPGQPAEPPTARPGSTATAAPAFAIERLRVQGLTIDFTDTTTEPATRLPLRDGDLSLQNVSTRAVAEARPVSFTFSATGGDVELERRVLRSSALAGLLGSAVDVVAGKADRHTLEKRPLFDELRVTGQLTLAPVAKGRVRTTIRSLELPALRGLGKRGGVDLADGVYDVDIAADLREGAGLHLTSRSVFTWLSLSEPPGGPISTYLRLPAPLDTVLFLLRNDQDEHVIPLTVELSPDRASGSDIAGAAAEALGRILTDAIASASLRTAGTLTGAVGLGGDAGPLPKASVAFSAGATAPTLTGLDEVLEALRDDARLEVSLSHDLGEGDLRRAAELANPPPDIVAAALTALRAERSTLLAQRQALAADTEALFAAGRMQDAGSRHAALTTLDARVGELERTIDEAVHMLAGESDRERDRRTRRAAATIAERRLEAVQQAIVARLGAENAARIESRRPRAVVAADTPEGGRVIATVRRRAAQ